MRERVAVIHPGVEYTTVLVITCRHCGMSIASPSSDYSEPFQLTFPHAKHCPLLINKPNLKGVVMAKKKGKGGKKGGC